MKLGILGGIGPESTMELYGRVIQIVQKRGIADNTRFPHIVINSIPAPELVNRDTSDKELEPYIRGVAELDLCGVDFIAMACNTIHLHRNRLQEGVKAEILDLRSGVERQLRLLGKFPVVVLGTHMTMEQGLYSFEGIRQMTVGDADSDGLAKAIFDFNRGVHVKEHSKFVVELARKYIEAGAGIIVLGCTEISLMIKDENMPKLDTMDVLADMIAEKVSVKSNKSGDTND